MTAVAVGMTAVKIGNVTVDANVFLAPMTGVTDLPFRRMVRKYGAGLVFSEMIASRCMIDEMRGSSKASLSYADEGIMAAQLAGCEPDIMAEAARINVDRGAAIIDINFGCPVKKVVNKFGGSALMKDEMLAAKIMEETVKAVNVPVTVKMRLGWDEQSINAPKLAKIAQDVGIQMITVHGRTRSQMYTGNANWDAVRAVKDSVTIPVMVNGDVTTPQDAKIALQKSGADGVMIGRGVYGRPWFLQQIIAYLNDGSDVPKPSYAALGDLVLEHYDAMLSHYGTHTGVSIARKHISWYCKDLPEAFALRADVNTSDDPAYVQDKLRRYFKALPQ